jgi:hypothetical protein
MAHTTATNATPKQTMTAISPLLMFIALLSISFMDVGGSIISSLMVVVRLSVGVVGAFFGTAGASTTVFLVGDVTTAWIRTMDDTDFRNGIMIVTGGGGIVTGGGIGELNVGDDGIAIGAEVGGMVVMVVTATGWSVVETDVMM